MDSSLSLSHYLTLLQSQTPFHYISVRTSISIFLGPCFLQLLGRFFVRGCRPIGCQHATQQYGGDPVSRRREAHCFPMCLLYCVICFLIYLLGLLNPTEHLAGASSRLREWPVVDVC
jgi:hypothetical protein